jgi:integrase
VGRVSVYPHHGAWWIYYRENGKPTRRKAGDTVDAAEQVAAQVNAQLTANAPTLFSFQPVTLVELHQNFLDYHENVLQSSLATVGRYRTATQHLVNCFSHGAADVLAHTVSASEFAAYLRRIEVAPNGHPNSLKRRLRDKGVQYILETCRSMYAFAAKRRHLPPYATNPFSELPLDRLKIQDAKPIFVFDQASELAFFKAARPDEFAVHFTLAKTGLRVGELTHLLIDDLDFDQGWLHVRNKPDLCWRIKTGNERRVPLIAELVSVLRQVIGQRRAGPVFLRARFLGGSAPTLIGGERELSLACERRVQERGATPNRTLRARVARSVWQDAGALKTDTVRKSFIRVTKVIGHRDATCPKSWRHTFATLLQDANVDPLVRQLTLGHQPTNGGGLGMTANYTHTRFETQRAQIEQALRHWPDSLKISSQWLTGGLP